ncbi:MAG: cob(I)yrinic acid a,c-diamide adenosyltransferase [Gammaproteobacteria bacterium]|nr:cob(I)yrinic acid a,c-diamide adenosyltransferase [Gammaproteobacteria bacterium]
MGHRLSKIYTRTGDTGSTGLADGSRVSKSSLRIATLGDIDELNSALGMLLAMELPSGIDKQLLEVQHDLFDLGGELAIPGSLLLPIAASERIETWIDAYNETLPPLKEFVLPSGPQGTGNCHFARAVCRRAERSLVGLAATTEISVEALKYLNRLSDLLFVLARVLARANGGQEFMWDRKRFVSPVG